MHEDKKKFFEEWFKLVYFRIITDKLLKKEYITSKEAKKIYAQIDRREEDLILPRCDDNYSKTTSLINPF